MVPLNIMRSFLEKAGRLWPEIVGRLRTRRETAPIDSVAVLQDFIASRSAYVAQKTLYEYVKARMGIRYPAMFADANVIDSLNIAKMHVFAACLSDLTAYAVAHALHGQPIGNEERQKLALRIFQSGLRNNAGAAPSQFSEQDAIDAFEHRLSETDWRSGARQPENFTESPLALFRWAPIADAMKKFDAEIVGNSVKFAWRDIREQFQKRIDAASIGADLVRQTAQL
jgi:hypothetical protein